ncbi:MAG: TolC family protein [Bacteroidales bacterium]|nr:TolC family protein [Bacteroidales bacterium]
MRKYIFAIAFLLTQASVGQNSLTFKDLQTLLFENNTELKKLQTEKQILQSEQQQTIWENPVISVSHNIYNPINGNYFDVSKQGETDIEAEIPVKNFQKAKMTKQKYNFLLQSKENGLQSLKSELSDMLVQSLADCFYYYNAEKLYNDELSALQDIVSAFETQYKNKNISAAEFANIQSVLFNLQSEAAQVQINKQNAYFETAKLLNTNINSDFHNVINAENVFKQANGFLLTADYDSLLALRFDIMALEDELQANYYAVKEFQKENIPSWSIKTEWDKNGNIARNIFLAGFSLQLPVFNRNQGNISAKKSENEALLQQKEFLINSYKKELAVYLDNLQRYCNLYASDNKNTVIDRSNLAKQMHKMLINKNISLIDWQNFCNNYRQMHFTTSKRRKFDSNNLKNQCRYPQRNLQILIDRKITPSHEINHAD